MQHSPARSSIDVGSVIRGTYTIEALLGRGGMGAVFLASHNRLPGKKVAIKVLHADLSGAEILARFEREARAASLLSHPHIVHIEDYNVTDDGTPFLVLEYLQGESLAQRLRRAPPLSLDEVRAIVRQVGSALAAAHARGIVHRDLKPQNIFLEASELDGHPTTSAKILDFGISKWRDSQTVQTQDSALLGTPQYMAPEQALGQHDNVDERSDVFALGAIVYEMLSGTPAFLGQSIPEVVFKVVYEQPVDLATRATSVPEPVRAAVARALAKPAAERFASVSAFVEALTGAPLPQPANRGVSSAIGPVEGASGSETGPRTPHTGRDAFERTVGTGDREAAPVLGLAPTVDSQSRPAGAIDARAHTAPAIASAPSDLASAPSTGEPAPGEPAAVPPALPAPPARRGALLATAVIAAAAAAAAMFVGMGGASRDRRAGAPTVASAGDAPHSDGGVARPSSSAPPVTTAGDAAAASPGSSAPPVTAAGDAPGGAPAASRPGSAGAPQATSSGRAPRTADPRPGAPERIGAPDRDVGPALEPPQSQDDDPRANPNAAAKLRQAETAKDSDRWQEVEKLVNQVLALEDLTPLQRARAHALRGIARCAQHDLQGGRAERNKLVSMRAPRRLLAELARACRQGREPAP